MVFMSYCPKSSPKPLFEPRIRISIQFWALVPNLSLIGWEIKKLRKNLIFDGTSGKLEMTSYLDNAYDITNFFGCFEKFLAYTVFLPSFIVVRHQIAELTWGGGGFAPTSNIGVARTPSKIGLR